jgi:putative tryptophan/tyrosine transport system substrate-binding protein
MAHRQSSFSASRREFVTFLGMAVTAWPLAARAQQGMRRVGVLSVNAESDPEGIRRLSRFTQGLAELGWIDGRNVRIDRRWSAGNVDRTRIFAKELVGLQPDVIFAMTTPATAALQRETRTIPIVFALVSNPIGDGFVASLPRPGGHMTGFSDFVESMAGKLLELLTEIAPTVKRSAIIFNPNSAPARGTYFLPLFEAAARSLNVEPIAAPVSDDREIETTIASFGREPHGGLVVMSDLFNLIHRAAIIEGVARNKVPAVYPLSRYVRDGGLLSYGLDAADQCYRAALYVDRILRGANPAELSVQLPTKFEMALNDKTAKALGLIVPRSIMIRADEVIE